MRRGSVALLASLFLAALALRPQLVGIGPLIPQIQDDLDVSHAVAGLLGTIPVLCMGLFAPPGAFLSDRLGPRFAITICLAGIAVFGLGRAAAPGAVGVLVLTFGMSIGLGAAQAIIPVAVKEDFPLRPAFATGVYALGINVGSAISSAIAVPIAVATGSWRWGLAAFSLFGLALVLAWLVLTRGAPRHRRSGEGPPRLPWHSGLAWCLGGIFGLQAIAFYGLNAWLPDAYVERGWSEEKAGALLAVVNIAALVTTVFVSVVADRWGSRRLYLTTFASILVVGLLGFVLWPDGAWVWVVLAGMAFGGMFPLVITLPLDVATRPADVGAVAGMMLFVGYIIGATAPLGLGAVRDITGSFTATLWLMVVAGAGLLLLCSALSRERLRAGTDGRPATR
jgi:CP family cyanate transporter-like MFS transporter